MWSLFSGKCFFHSQQMLLVYRKHFTRVFLSFYFLKFKKWICLVRTTFITSYKPLWATTMGGSVVKNPPANAENIGSIPDPGRSPAEKKMAIHSSIHAWEIPWTEQSGGLQSMGLQRVRNNLATEQQQINYTTQWSSSMILINILSFKIPWFPGNLFALEYTLSIWKKQESSRRTSISALVTMPKPLTVWITINCGKFWKRWEYQNTWSASWEICMQIRKQQLELDMNNRLVPNRKRSSSRLYIITLFI